MTTTLYELADLREALTAQLEEAEGELTPEMEKALDALEGRVEEKIERIGLYIREQQVDAERIKIEESRLTARRKARERAAESLKSYLLAQMQRLGKEKVQGLLCTVAIQKSPMAVTTALDQVEMESLADRTPYITTIPVSYRLNRDAVLAAHKAGAQLPDGILVSQNSHIRVR